MTYKEAIDAIQLDGVEIIATLPRMYSFTEGLKKAEEVFKRADKYRWHDLRKNTKDLPNEEFTNVFVAIDFFGTEMYSVCAYEDGTFHDGINPPLTFNKYIKAWREIEPFKEE